MRNRHARMRKIPPSSTGMRLLDPVRPCSVAASGKLDRNGILVGAALAVLEGIVEGCEKLEPPLDSRLVIPHCANTIEVGRRVGVEDITSSR